MSKKPISQKRAEREKAEDRALNRVFGVFLLGLAAECYLFILYRAALGTIDSMVTCYQVIRWSSWLGLILLLGGALVAYLKRSDRKLRTVMLWIAGLGVFLAVSGWIMYRFSNYNYGITVMCILVPIAAVLALVFQLYQRECFLCTIALAGSLFTVWVRGASLNSGFWRTPVIVGAVLGAVILAAAAALVRTAQQAEGKLWGVRVCSLECDYRIIYGVLGIAFVCVLLAVAVPSITYYLMWALGVLAFAELVYYTTKLM